MGVTATSHKVIVNLLDAVCEAAEREGVAVRGIQKAGEDSACAHPSIECTGSNPRVPAALGDGANLAAGTVWLWARPEMAGSVDVLFVDEAGQISLANVLAAPTPGSSWRRRGGCTPTCARSPRSCSTTDGSRHGSSWRTRR